MGHAVGDVLGEAAGVAVSPPAIIAIFLLLATSRARLNRLLFVVGWVSLDPTGKGRRRWTNRWKAALNAFDMTFDGRFSACRR